MALHRTHKNTLIRQKEIAAAVKKLIVNHGSENVTIKKMAQEIGVTEGAIYRHFKSKKDILSFLLDDIRQTLISDIKQNYSGTIQSSEMLEKIILKHISLIQQRKGVTFQVIAEIISFGDKELNDKAFGVISEYIATISAILNEAVKNGVVRNDIKIDSMAKLFFGMTQGLVSLWALSRYHFNLEDEYQLLWGIFLRTIRKPETSGNAAAPLSNLINQ